MPFNQTLEPHLTNVLLLKWCPSFLYKRCLLLTVYQHVTKHPHKVIKHCFIGDVGNQQNIALQWPWCLRDGFCRARQKPLCYWTSSPAAMWSVYKVFTLKSPRSLPRAHSTTRLNICITSQSELRVLCIFLVLLWIWIYGMVYTETSNKRMYPTVKEQLDRISTNIWFHVFVLNTGGSQPNLKCCMGNNENGNIAAH